MTYPDSQPGRHAASATLSASRARNEPATPSRAPRFPRQGRTLSPDRAADVLKEFTEGNFCTLCGGIHAGLSMPACPRVASFELDPDGKLKAATFWPDGEYDASGTYLASDVEVDGD